MLLNSLYTCTCTICVYCYTHTHTCTHAHTHAHTHTHLLLLFCIHSCWVVQATWYITHLTLKSDYVFLLVGLFWQNLTCIVKPCFLSNFPQWGHPCWHWVILLCFCLVWFTRPALLRPTKWHACSEHLQQLCACFWLIDSLLCFNSSFLLCSSLSISSFTSSAAALISPRHMLRSCACSLQLE